MRGVVLAGGTGSRLGKATQLVNKHCLPVYNKLMIEWAIKVLEDNKIHDITIISSIAGCKQIKWVLGEQYDYREQDKPGGIPHAINCADRCDDEPITVILGDNLFLPTPEIPDSVVGAHTFLYRVTNQRELSQLGVAEFDTFGNIRRLMEKPSNPPSKYAVTGLYVFNKHVFDMIKTLSPSKRGELEVTDLLNAYKKKYTLTYSEVVGFWGDAGTIDGLLTCSLEAKDEKSWLTKY